MVAINMEGIETSVLVPEGDYEVKVSEVTKQESSAGKPYLKWVLVITEGSCKGQKVYHNTSLQPQALFNLKSVLLSLGQSVPNKVLKLDLDELEGETMGVTISHELYEGKKKPRISETFPLEDTSIGGEDEEEEGETEGEEEETEEEEAEEEAEEGAEEEEVDLDNMNLAELIKFAKDNGFKLELSIKDKRNVKKVREAIEAALEETDI